VNSTPDGVSGLIPAGEYRIRQKPAYAFGFGRIAFDEQNRHPPGRFSAAKTDGDVAALRRQARKIDEKQIRRGLVQTAQFIRTRGNATLDAVAQLSQPVDPLRSLGRVPMNKMDQRHGFGLYPFFHPFTRPGADMKLLYSPVASRGEAL